MAEFIATYDIESGPGEPHDHFKQAAQAQGWTDTVPGPNGRQIQLPNTTLVGSFPTAQAAYDAFDRAVTVGQSEMKTGKLTVEASYIVQRVPPGRAHRISKARATIERIAEIMAKNS
jgi:hypothetical protein